MGSDGVDKYRNQKLEGRFVFFCIVLCPLLCGLVPLVVLNVMHSRAVQRQQPVVYPSCDDTLSLSGWAYVRPFGEPHDYGRPGLSHVTVHGAVHHRAKEAVEVWQQAFAPGKGTPIHRHDCEEVFVVLAGNGTMYARRGLQKMDFGANSTIYIPPNDVHQIVNTGTELLQMIVTITRPPITVFIYDSWATPDGLARLVAPYFWDKTCPGENTGAQDGAAAGEQGSDAAVGHLSAGRGDDHTTSTGSMLDTTARR